MKTTSQNCDVVFNNNTDSNNKGFNTSFDECMTWINNNSNSSYFTDYAGGTISIIDNETGDELFSKEI